jgi:hypothetical protein
MAKATKTWTEKLTVNKQPEITKIDKPFADMPAGTKMYISTPQLIAAYINQIPKGKSVEVKTLREDLALENGASFTCPLTTGIFLRIVAEAAHEQWLNGVSEKKITPFWRVVEPNSPLAKKLSFGQQFLIEQRAKEKT